jgi:putative nucleotidyltransferase with HDIG domain
MAASTRGAVSGAANPEPRLSHLLIMVNRDSAWSLLCEWTQGEPLRKHALAVEAAVRHYARTFGENEEEWGAVALLHDFDYERYPTLENHPFRGAEVLREKGYPEWVVHAVLSHADHTQTPRETRLEHTLFACDEMAGFVTAAALVRPSKSVLDLEPSSVVKRMKDKAFARAVSRDDLRRGAEELGLPLADHIGHVIAGMRDQAEALGLKGTL